MGDPRMLLDPRWHWIRSAAQRLWAELEDDAQLLTLTVTVASPAGELMFYAAEAGSSEVHRRVFTDLDGAAALTDRCSVDVSAEDVTG